MASIGGSDSVCWATFVGQYVCPYSYTFRCQFAPNIVRHVHWFAIGLRPHMGVASCPIRREKTKSTRQAMGVRVIIYGYYGFGNAGDEAVLAGMLRGLRQHGPDNAHYVVLSGNPAH